MTADSERTTVRIRKLACALLQLMLLAIYPIAALRSRRGTGASAELVFAAIEREGIEHRYVYEWDLGPMSDLVTPDRAMTILKAAPDLIFPFAVSGGIELNRVLDLDHVRWPRDNGNPVLISQADSTSFTFLTLPGHFRGPGRTIQFTILGRGGRLILRQVGATSRRISDLAYDGGAWLSWRTQAATLRAVISPEAARRPGARAGAPSLSRVQAGTPARRRRRRASSPAWTTKSTPPVAA